MALFQVQWDSTNNRFKRSASSVADYRAGQQTVGSGATSVSVTFSSAIASTSYAPVCSWINTSDGSPQFQPIVITAFSTTGFTASWNVATDTANYIISWQVTVNN